MKKEDQIIAFFPCIRFEDQIQMNFRGTNYSQTKWNDLQKLQYDLKLHDELHDLYKYVTKLAIICIKRGIARAEKKRRKEKLEREGTIFL